MNKHDLENGYIVELRNGTRLFYCDGSFYSSSFEQYNTLQPYKDDLRHISVSDFDINKVYLDGDSNVLIWDRNKECKKDETICNIIKLLKSNQVSEINITLNPHCSYNFTF